MKDTINKIFKGILKGLGHIIINLSFIRVKEYNKKPLKGLTYVLAPNHTTDKDGPIMWTSHENIRIVAKKECFKNPLKAKFLNYIDIIEVDRDTPEGRAKALRQSVKYFKKKDKPKVLLIFTQGTISDINKNTLGRFEDGPFAISALTNTPMVPAFMEQAHWFSKNRVVYGEPYIPDVLDERRKVDREKLLEAKAYWQQEILRLQQQAVELENRPIKILKLDPKHQNNNDG